MPWLDKGKHWIISPQIEVTLCLLMLKVAEFTHPGLHSTKTLTVHCRSLQIDEMALNVQNVFKSVFYPDYFNLRNIFQFQLTLLQIADKKEEFGLKFKVK